MPNRAPRRILFVDPSRSELDDVREAVDAVPSTEVEVVTNGRALGTRLERDPPIDLVVLDLDLGDGKRNDEDLVRAIRADHEDLPIIVTSRRGDVKAANRVIEAGATDFIVRGDTLEARIATTFAKVNGIFALVEQNRRLRQQNTQLLEAQAEQHRIVGESPLIADLRAKIARVAPVPRPVLIRGERGTGKELVAHAIHLASGAPDRPFLTVNCAAFSDTLLESELFGHRKGSFTGADSDRSGKFALADGGTLFLDEIGHMSRAFQSKILRVVEYGTFTPVGSHEEITVSTRIVAATNADLESKMADGDFLRDLYDRLAFEVIEVPPLRTRIEDIRMLAQHFLEKFMNEVPEFQGKTLTDETVAMLERHSFPGNIRELKNIIERAVYRDTTDTIDPEDIGMLAEHPLETPGGNFKEKVEAFEARLIADALSAAGGNQKKASDLLGLSYHQFRYYNKKHSGEAEAEDSPEESEE